jgi:clan AA aspartic protease
MPRSGWAGSGNRRPIAWGCADVKGEVNRRLEAVIPLQVRGPTGLVAVVAAIADTGFSASMTLPAATVAAIELVRQSSRGATLGDGTVRQFDLFAAEIEWNGSWRQILVHKTGSEVLIGSRLLANHRLVIDLAAGGVVQIEPLPA